eukprot:gene24416-10015_t
MQLQLMQQFTRLLVFYGLVCWSSSYVIQGFREPESSSPNAGHGSVHVPGPDSCRFPTCMPSPSCPASSRSNTWRWYPGVSSAGFEAPSPDPDPGYHAPMLQWAYKLKTKRFTKPNPASSALRPGRHFYDFGVEKAIQKLFNDPVFCARRGTGPKEPKSLDAYLANTLIKLRDFGPSIAGTATIPPCVARGLNVTAHIHGPGVKQRGTWVMEDYLHFLDCYSSYLFHGVALPPKAAEMWSLLRDGLLPYFRFANETVYNVNSRANAKVSLLAYAKMVESAVGPKGCTYVLHVMCCRLSAQESAHGHPVQTLEFWVERMIQQMKSSTKFLTTGCPEFLYVKGMLIDNRLAELRSQHINLKSFDDYIPNYQHRPFSGDGFDSGNGYDQLLGKGVAYYGVKKEWAVAVLSRLIQEDEMHEDPEVLPWDEAFRLELVEWPELTIREHVYAHAKGDTIFTSLGHKRSRTRKSLHCLVWYTIGNVRSPFVGKIKCFLIIVGLTTRSGVPLPPLRVAVADFIPLKK